MAAWWEIEGFASEPERRKAKGSELLYRVYGGASRPISKCFFRPKDERKLLLASRFSADDIEMELNVALWGNAIKEIGLFRPRAGAAMFEGLVAQDIPTYDWVSFVGAGEATLLQVWIDEPVADAVTLLKTFPVRPGNFHVPSGPFSSGSNGLGN